MEKATLSPEAARPVAANKRGEEQIVGKWYILCSNPNPQYHDKIAMDHMIYRLQLSVFY